MHRRRIAIVTAIALAVGACGADDVASDPTTTAAPTTTTTTAPAVLTILVTNDDGIGAPGVDALVSALVELDDVEVVVVAPADNQSATSDAVTPGGATFTAGTTASGVEATAVAGFPADSVAVALDDLGIEPDIVVSGVNEGQNVGPVAFVSGTVGAARVAVRRGIPAVAGSAGFGAGADYDRAVALIVAFIEEHRTEIAEGTLATDGVFSFNVPDCTAGTASDLLEVPLAAEIPEGVNPFQSDCSLEAGVEPVDDVSALVAGHPALTVVPPEAPAG